MYLLYGLAIVTVVGAPTLPAYRDTLLVAPASTVLRTPFGRWKYMTAESPGFNEIGPLPIIMQIAGFPPVPSTSITRLYVDLLHPVSVGGGFTEVALLLFKSPFARFCP